MCPPTSVFRARCGWKLPRADALEHGVRAVATGELPRPFDALVAALGDDVGGAELAAEVGAVVVPAHQQDPLGAEPLRREHRGQPDRAVADDRHRRARPNPDARSTTIELVPRSN
jgi:hypothetical protein